jgi:ABC-type multidrug transport system fused ATPase/permease subunit
MKSGFIFPILSTSEAAFRAALHTAVVSCGRAVLTVAHRLAIAQDAERVFVLDVARLWKGARQSS